MQRRLRIALLVESHRTYERNLLRGIAAYAHAHGPWSFYNMGGTLYNYAGVLDDTVTKRLKKWAPDGLIIRCEDQRLMSRIRRLKLPVVDLLGWHRYKNIPAIDTDHEAVTRLAADQLIERGFRQFAFCGFDSLYYSMQRAKYFVDYISSLGYSVNVFRCSKKSKFTSSLNLESHGVIDTTELEKWICSLPTPVGVMACNDIRGQQIIDTCSKYGILVPEQIAVIAVGNDDVICNLCDPTLSSIEPNTKKMGYEAANILNRMISGNEYLTGITRIEPLGITQRQSTDALSISDSQITAALHFIRRHASEGINVSDVVSQVHLSRSTLERRFINLVGRSPKEEIIRLQIKRVQQLLARTDYRLAKIAHLSGFNHIEYMCKVFKKKTGMTPSQYRKTIVTETGVDTVSRIIST